MPKIQGHVSDPARPEITRPANAAAKKSAGKNCDAAELEEQGRDKSESREVWPEVCNHQSSNSLVDGPLGGQLAVPAPSPG